MLRRPAFLLAIPLPVLILVGALLLGGGSYAAIQGTSTPSFCGTCHEMKAFKDAWAKGAHQGISCVSCHVDPSAVAQTVHKVEALKEVYDHFATTPRFPGGSVEVPDSRCLACHKDLPKVTKSGFQHAIHATRAACVTCHATAGHKVTTTALAKAGHLASIPRAPPATSTIAATSSVGATASVAGTSSVGATPSIDATALLAAKHIKTACTDCHLRAAAPQPLTCAKCHTAPHQPRGTCVTCHSPGPKWAFSHPAAVPQTNCTTCHKPPANHYTAATCLTCHNPAVPFAKTVFSHSTPGTATTCYQCHNKPAKHLATVYNCASCHNQPGKAWSFSHPASTSCDSCHNPPRSHYGSSCSSCHTPKVAFAKTTYTHTSNSCSACHSKPGGHVSTAYNCATCHRQPGRSWAFSHPSGSAAASCAKCHSKPARHVSTGASCTSCHQQKAGTSWAFTHPTTASTACQACHSKPSGHVSTGYSCTTCHRQKPGTSWAFSHPTSKSCESCHSRPSTPAPRHYGSSCSKCHTPSVPFGSASFTHPKIGTNSPHTSRSFSCATCHPVEPPSWSIPKKGCICHNLGGGWGMGSSSAPTSLAWHSG